MRTAGLPASVLEYTTIRIGQRFDIFYGGIIGAPKFPSVQLVEFLFRGYLRTGAPQLQQLARTASITWRWAACTIMSAEVFIATRPTSVGSFRISKRCSTTMPRSSIC